MEYPVSGSMVPVELEEVLVAEEDTVRMMVQTYGCAGWNSGAFPRFRQDPFGKRDFTRKELRKHMPRFAAAWCWFFACVYVNNIANFWLQANLTGFYESQWKFSQSNFTAAQAWLKKNDPKTYKARWGAIPPEDTRSGLPANSYQESYANKTVKLFDLTYLYLPHVQGSGFADTFAYASLLVGLFRFVVLPGPMSLRWTFFTRILSVWGVLFLTRAFTITVTPLPNPFQQCEARVTFPKNILLEAFAGLPIMTPIFFNEVSCQDVMFSGHTACGTLWTLFSWRYLNKAPWFQPTPWSFSAWSCTAVLVDCFVCSWLCFGWYVIAASQFHYTVDVVVGAILTIVAYYAYHSLIKTIWLKRGHPFIARVIGPFVKWFEVHAVDLKFWRIQARCLMKDELEQMRRIAADRESVQSDA